MSQRSCEDCRWDVKSESHGLRMIQCGQGHARTFQKIITDCHAWEEKPKCWWCDDWLAFTKESKGFPIYEVMKKLIGLNAEAPECPICGRKHKETI